MEDGVCLVGKKGTSWKRDVASYGRDVLISKIFKGARS